MTEERFDEPIDFSAVSETDALVERLRASLHAAEAPRAAVVWDDDDDTDEPAYALLSALQRDVSSDLPTPFMTRPVVALDSRRRGVGRAATVAAVTAGVLSLAGAAAASSSPGDALYGVRTAVASAVGSVLDAVTPSSPVGPKPEGVRASATATATAGIRGDQVSDQARSTNAIRQIKDRLATADRLIKQEKWTAALNVLAKAERSLEAVLPADRGLLPKQINDLQALALSGQAADRADDDEDNSGKNDDDSGTRPDKSDPSGRTSDDDDRSGSSGPDRGEAADRDARDARDDRDDAPDVRPTAVRGSGSGADAGADGDLLDRSKSGSSPDVAPEPSEDHDR